MGCRGESLMEVEARGNGKKSRDSSYEQLVLRVFLQKNIEKGGGSERSLWVQEVIFFLSCKILQQVYMLMRETSFSNLARGTGIQYPRNGVKQGQSLIIMTIKQSM